MVTGRWRKQKGKELEDYVAKQFQRIDKYAYRRADSGSGKSRKEDVFTVLPFFIECKHHKTPSIGAWFRKAELDTPRSKYTILVYKGDRQRGATVYMKTKVFLSVLAGIRIEEGFEQFVTMELSDFISLLEEKNVHAEL